MSTLEYLEKLLAFDSTSAHPNAGLIEWVQAQVGENGTDHLIQLKQTTSGAFMADG